tara:strand:- start:563 stop:1639 length:1077 start_codon:yes stop_codon:yes gene_type:complete
MLSKPHVSKNFLGGNDIYHFHPEYHLVFSPYNLMYDWDQPNTFISNGTVKTTQIHPQSDYIELLVYEDSCLIKKHIEYTSDSIKKKTTEYFDKNKNLIEKVEVHNGVLFQRKKYQYEYNDNSDVIFIQTEEESHFKDKDYNFKFRLYYKYLDYKNMKIVLTYEPSTLYNTRINLFEKDILFPDKYSKFIKYSLSPLPLNIEYSNEQRRMDYIDTLIRNPETLLFKFDGENKNLLYNKKEYNYNKFGDLISIEKFKCDQEIIGLGNVPNKTPEYRGIIQFEYNNEFKKISKIDDSIINRIKTFEYDRLGNLKRFKWFNSKTNEIIQEYSCNYKYDNNLVVEHKIESKTGYSISKIEYYD